MKSTSDEVNEALAFNAAQILLKNPSMAPAAAAEQAIADMLKNNPFTPPVDGCPIATLPNEVLACIFLIGTEEEIDEREEEGGCDSEDDWTDVDEDEDDIDDVVDLKDGTGWVTDDDEEAPELIPAKDEPTILDVIEDDDSDDEDTEPEPLFPVLVSHVCRHWREVALSSPALWSDIHIQYGTHPDRIGAFLERSKAHPLDVSIDTQAPDSWEEDAVLEEERTKQESHYASPDAPAPTPTPRPFITYPELERFLDLLIPHVDRWYNLLVEATFYESLYRVLARLAQCHSAKQLELLHLYHLEEECDQFETFEPPAFKESFVPFHGNVPNLKAIALWGVHIDWDASLSLFKGLSRIELAYHAQDVRPSFTSFQAMLQSPNLQAVSLALSGPSDTSEWSEDIISLPTVKSLVMSYHEAAYIERLYVLLSTPNVTEMELDFEAEDFSAFGHLLASPMAGLSRSLLAGIETLKIGNLPVDTKTVEEMLGQLKSLKVLRLNCRGQEVEFFEKLMTLRSTGNFSATESVSFGQEDKVVVYCPNLKSVGASGIDGKSMRQLMEMRAAGGVPLTTVAMGEEDDLDEDDEEWINKHATLERFEESDEEELEELIDVDDDDDGQMDVDTDEDEDDQV